MEENLEIEFKVLIDKEIYQQIYNDHHIDHQSVSYTHLTLPTNREV